MQLATVPRPKCSWQLYAILSLSKSFTVPVAAFTPAAAAAAVAAAGTVLNLLQKVFIGLPCATATL